MQPVLAVRACVVQLVKAEGSAQALAVMFVCARAILAAPKAVHDRRMIPGCIFKLGLPVFKWAFLRSTSIYSVTRC